MSPLRDGLLDRLWKEVEHIVRHEGMELVDLEYKSERSGWVLRIFIDRDGGVDLEDCAEVSKQVGMMLDVENIIQQSYTLEVSSPGLDRKLRKPEDFKRFEGRMVRIKLVQDHAGRKKFRGRLSGLEGGEVLLQDLDEGCTHRLLLDEIASARLEIEL